MTDNDIIDLETAAKRLGITPKTLNKWVRKYNLPMIKIGKVIRFDWPKLFANINQRFSTAQ